MFKPIALYIGIRYTRNKRRHRFISLISLMSMLGIALGMTVLITVLSVLNGFDREIKKSVFSIISPITVGSMMGRISHWHELENLVATTAGVTGVAPFVNGQALLQHADATQPVMIMGVLPEQEKNVSGLADKVIQGEFTTLKADSFGMVLGEHLADKLGAVVGDKITLITSKRTGSTATDIAPRFKNFTVMGIYRAGGGGFDTKLAYIHLQDAQKTFEFGSGISALHVNVKNVYAAPHISKQLTDQLPANIQVSNWTVQLGDFFHNISSTKTMMFFIFLLIIIVAAFNLVCTLVMAVKNKTADIAILRTMGATPATIMAIFVVHGAMIGLGGILLGMLCGVTLALHVTDVVNWIQIIFHVQLVSSNIYYVDYLPSELQWSDVWQISWVALVLSLLATLYPAWSAARTQPVEGLRYD